MAVGTDDEIDFSTDEIVDGSTGVSVVVKTVENDDENGITIELDDDGWKASIEPGNVLTVEATSEEEGIAGDGGIEASEETTTEPTTLENDEL